MQLHNSTTITAFLVLLLVTSCGNREGSDPFDATRQLTAEQRTEILGDVIRFAGKLPPGAAADERLSPEHDHHYAQLLDASRLEYYQSAVTWPASGHSPAEERYLLVSTPAPSLHNKRFGIGIRYLIRDGEVVDYEEMFRTWRFTEEEMHSKGRHLFAVMVSGGDLTPYKPQNSGSREYIEFPDEFVRFDSGTRTWVSSRIDPLQALLSAGSAGTGD